MQRIDGPTASPSLPDPSAVSGTPGYFTGGDPSVPTPPTIVSPDWLNMIQEEIVAVILASGAALSKTNRTQLRDAIQALVAAGGVTFASAAETIAGLITNKVVHPQGAAALVTSRISGLVDGAVLDTLRKLSSALGNDPNYAATVTAALGARAFTSRKITASGLAVGGGDLTADRIINVPAATMAEFIAGTSATTVLTPAAMAAASGDNANGYWYTVAGGKIEMGGSVTLLPNGSSSNTGTITFPTSFNEVCWAITGNADDGPSNTFRPCTVTFPGGPSLNGCGVRVDSTNKDQKFTSPRIVWWKATGR
ncbi:hypothetical protein OMP43_17445 [Sphingomonas sp. CBMAI 2297]|uniref:hypothetical protein n=1 Tax=Sphingomonas sp. CBMAI 2297 TaxID=2991720 RepID=UPI002458B5DD|nr:hypothetical protein [Sphingomonas sp. CBMAI 2297]MDH4745813.1 hypothetical protein [Sphingomonas sp. CBMAI 2297]